MPTRKWERRNFYFGHDEKGGTYSISSEVKWKRLSKNKIAIEYSEYQEIEYLITEY